MEAFGGLALPEHVEVAAGAELGQEAEPFGGVDAGVERGQERVVQHFEDFPLGFGATFFTPAGELLLVHHFGGKEAALGVGRCGLDLCQVDGADVAGTEPEDEAEVGEAELASR